MDITDTSGDRALPEKPRSLELEENPNVMVEILNSRSAVADVSPATKNKATSKSAYVRSLSISI